MSAAEQHLGDAAPKPSRALRLVPPILPTTPCQLWTGPLDRDGYGRRYFQGRRTSAHRAAWIEAHGPIPPGMTIDHRCFTPACIAADHLRLATKSVNSRNQRSAYKTHCVNGHEFTPENTYPRRDSGRRSCRACNAQAVQRYKSRKRCAA